MDLHVYHIAFLAERAFNLFGKIYTLCKIYNMIFNYSYIYFFNVFVKCDILLYYIMYNDILLLST